jgi:site-specific recombinase XerD
MMFNGHPKVVQEMLRHSQVSTTLDIYSHVSPGMQDEAVKRFGSLFS